MTLGDQHSAARLESDRLYRERGGEYAGGIQRVKGTAMATIESDPIQQQVEAAMRESSVLPPWKRRDDPPQRPVEYVVNDPIDDGRIRVDQHVSSDGKAQWWLYVAYSRGVFVPRKDNEPPLRAAVDHAIESVETFLKWLVELRARTSEPNTQSNNLAEI